MNGFVYLLVSLYRHQIQSSANEKVLATKKDLQRLTVVVRHGDKQQKLQVERLTSDFQKVVEIYSSCQQVGLIITPHKLIESIAINRNCFFLFTANCGQIERNSLNKRLTAG